MPSRLSVQAGGRSGLVTSRVMRWAVRLPSTRACRVSARNVSKVIRSPSNCSASTAFASGPACHCVCRRAARRRPACSASACSVPLLATAGQRPWACQWPATLPASAARPVGVPNNAAIVGCRRNSGGKTASAGASTSARQRSSAARGASRPFSATWLSAARKSASTLQPGVRPFSTTRPCSGTPASTLSNTSNSAWPRTASRLATSGWASAMPAPACRSALQRPASRCGP